MEDKKVEEAQIVGKLRTMENVNQEYSQLVLQLGDQVYKILKQFDFVKAQIDKLATEAATFQKPKE